MKKSQIEKLKAIIEEEEKQYDFNDFVFNYIDEEDLKNIEDIEDLIEYLELANQDYNITQTEVIYYSNAINYLKENDNSLEESLEIAESYGYKINDLNSELLASLLKSRNNEEDYREFLNEIENKESEIFGNE